MQLQQFYSPSGDGFSFTREHACTFAKQVADDFNPIHDVDASRFCVPGDLLFAVALSRLGLSQSMEIRFADMVVDGVTLHLHEAADGAVDIRDDDGKTYLVIRSQGEKTLDQTIISRLTQEYVAFSGKTFPHVLVPLWQEHNVMINTARPLVIYESMHLTLDTLDFTAPTLELSGATLDVDGKRGYVRLAFDFKEGDKHLGCGEKRMVLSGLKAYDQAAIDGLVAYYNQRKIDLG